MRLIRARRQSEPIANRKEYHHQRGLIVGRGERVTFTPDGQRHAEKLGDPGELIKHYKIEDWNTYRIVCRGPENTLLTSTVF